MRFAAIELKAQEDIHAGVEIFFRLASGLGLVFTSLEPFGTTKVGSMTFLRFRTDCPNLDLLVPSLQGENRGVILPAQTGYVLYTQTTKGTVAVITMQSTKPPGLHRKYRGTASKFWERQFPTLEVKS